MQAIPPLTGLKLVVPDGENSANDRWAGLAVDQSKVSQKFVIQRIISGAVLNWAPYDARFGHLSTGIEEFCTNQLWPPA